MPLDQWLAFVAASAVLLAIPGPTILLVVSYALSHGRREAGATIAGVVLGDFTAMTASMLGLGVLLATSATLFAILKWAGAAYLVFLGVKLWRAPVAPAGPADPPAPAVSSRRILLHAFMVTSLNPKTIVFFVAFLPQFVDPARSFLVQMIVLEATFLALAIVNTLIYGALASRAGAAVRRPGVRRAVNRTGGGLMIAAGLGAALWRRSPV